MARVTVEDCVDKVTSRFELVLLASQRAREIAAGSPLTIERDNDKDPVIALREIADETVTPEDLREAKVRDLQRYVERDEPEEDDLSLEVAGRELAAANEDITPENLAKVLSDMVVSEAEAEFSGSSDEEAGEAGAEPAAETPKMMFQEREQAVHSVFLVIFNYELEVALLIKVKIAFHLLIEKPQAF